MSNILKAKLKVCTLAILMVSLLGVGSGVAPSSSAQTTVDEFIASGDFTTVVALNGGTLDGSILTYNVADFAVPEVSSCDASAEVTDFTAQLIADVNAGAVNGTVSFDLNTIDTTLIPTDIDVTLDATLLVAAVPDSAEDMSILAAAANSTKVRANVKFKGMSHVGNGFGINNLAMSENPSPAGITVGFGRDNNPGGSDARFICKASRFNVPGIGLGGAEFKVSRWGNTPKALKSLEKTQVSIDSNAVQIDALSGTVSAKHTILVKKTK